MWTTARAERLPGTDGPWSHSALAPPGVDDEHVYAVTRRYDDLREDVEGLYAFDLVDGSLVWSRSAPGGIGRTYRLDDALVLVGGVGPELQSVAPGDGRLRWRRRPTGSRTGTGSAACSPPGAIASSGGPCGAGRRTWRRRGSTAGPATSAGGGLSPGRTGRLRRGDGRRRRRRGSAGRRESLPGRAGRRRRRPAIRGRAGGGRGRRGRRDQAPGVRGVSPDQHRDLPNSFFVGGGFFSQQSFHRCIRPLSRSRRS